LSKRIAIIDLGTNTFNLLVAEKTAHGFERLYQTKEGVALGLGGINENKLSADAMERGMGALKNFTDISLKFHAEKIYAFGTSALRNAKNAHELIGRAKSELNLEIEVISGMREAELIYKGVSSGYDFTQDALIMDIGGGSTEFILANQSGILKARSFEIGVSRIYQLFQFSDPMSASDCKKIYQYLEEKTDNYFDTVQCKQLIGASGSFETFYKLAYNRECEEDLFIPMNIQDVNESLAKIIASTQAERDANPLIIPIRKKMAPLAAVKTKWIIDKLEISELIISPYALKEGVISEL
jgi:exopolyphosphatase/guanosine-5'-triphosphate,3'-diphosphate pyrophosphatase